MARYNLTREQTQKRAASRREYALARAKPSESVARVTPSGPMSFPIKARDAETEQMIRDFQNRKGGGR